MDENQKSECSGNTFFSDFVSIISHHPLQVIKNNSQFKVQKGIFDIFVSSLF